MSHITRSVLGGAVPSTLSGAITAGSPGSGGTFTVAAATNWPTANFAVVVDPGTATTETILCSSRSGTTLTVATSGRGYDNSTAQSHANNAVIVPDFDAVAISALLEHLNTDAGTDHTGYVASANLEQSGDLTTVVQGATATAGTTGRYASARHQHPVTSPPALLVTASVDQTLTTAVLTKLVYGTVTVDTSSGWSAVNNRYTIPAGFGGIWSVSAIQEFAANATGVRSIEIVQTGTTKARHRTPACTGIGTICSVSALLSCSVGDTVEIDGLQNSGGNLAATATAWSVFQMHWVRP